MALGDRGFLHFTQALGYLNPLSQFNEIQNSPTFDATQNTKAAAAFNKQQFLPEHSILPLYTRPVNNNSGPSSK